MSRRFLVTGADGFCGAHIIAHLIEQGVEVVGMVRREPLRLPVLGVEVPLVYHDLAEPISPQVSAEIGPVDVVLSLASSTDIAGSISDPLRVFRENIDVVGNLAEWARHQPIEAFVQISSEEVYGPAPHHPHVEWEPIRPSTPYSASKAAQEALLISMWRSNGLPLVILNAMNMIGPMQPSTKLVPTILRKLLAGKTVPLIVDWYDSQSGCGEESLRQYMHPRVLADAILATFETAEQFTPKAQFPPRFNVAGTQVGNIALAQMVADAAGVPLRWEPVEANHSRPGHERVFALDDSKLRNLGWVPPTSLGDDVRDTVAWYLEHAEWL